VTVLRPPRGWLPVDLAELWRYRELLWILARRDVSIRYKQTLLGASWAVIQPFMTMVVFSVLFGLLLGREGKPTLPGVPYAISTYCALVPWYFFANGLNQSGNSLLQNRNLITRVYFPRLIAPMAPLIAALVDFAIALGVLLGMIAFFDLTTDYVFRFSWALLTLPLFTLMAMATSLAVGLWLSAMNAIYRDVRYAIPFLIQLWMVLSPVVYTADSVLTKLPDWLRPIYGLNPLTGVVEGFRWALLGGTAPPGAILIGSAGMVLVLLVSGLFYFRRMEQTFADVV
jgi:lipopolysaccharide transport system permease protein